MTSTTETYTLSLHDALPICAGRCGRPSPRSAAAARRRPSGRERPGRSEEHTSELQSPVQLVCRLLLEKKKPPLSALTADDTSPKPVTNTIGISTPSRLRHSC